jgi:LuxR family transcriptional regulator, maltose regulon positive regulatory protein
LIGTVCSICISQDVLTNAAKERLYRVIERHVRSLTPDQQEALVAASVYRSFTIDQIYDLCRDLVSREELIQYCSEASFLIYDYKKGAYSFHPLMRLYVRNRFNELPQEKRNAIYERAARWFQKQEEYRECIAYAFRGQADELALEAVEAGGAHSLVGFSVDRVLALLHRLDHKMRAKHLGGCQLMILYATLNSAQSAAASERESLTASLPPDYEPTASEWAGFWVLKGIAAVPDLKAMLPYFRRARTLCQVAGVQLPRDFFDGVTRGVAGQLFLYYRGPGQLQDNVRDLTEIYECCGVIMEGVDADSWIAVLQGEVSYMTGHFEPAYDFTKRLSLAGYRTDDQREQAAVALSLLPRILLFEGQQEEFSAWVDYYHVLEKEMTTPVWKADLEIVADFIRALLEQPTEEIKQTLEKYLKWSPYPSLNPMWQTTRHRLVMKAGRFQTIDITGPTPIPSGTSLYSQTNRMYDNIAYVVAELNLGHR